jgi:hypothetical protein
MKKYFEQEVKDALRATTAASKGTGSNYFSSKSENDNFFGKEGVKGTPIRVTDYVNIPKSEDSNINAHNVVIFDDGHQMSESRFFSAKGIKWPVGGKQGKCDYLIRALENDVRLTVVPESVSVDYIRYADGGYCVRVGEVTQNKKGEMKEITNDKGKKETVMTPPANAIQTATYTFAPVTFPEIKEEA